MREPFFEGVLSGGAKLAEITLEESYHLGGYGHLLGGARELLEDVLQPSTVVSEEESMGHREGFAGGLRGNEGIAVAVATDP